MNFDGVQDDNTDNGHDQGSIVGLRDVLEDVDVGLKLEMN